MGRKQDTFMKGMEAGARPFEEKFTKLSETTHQMGKEINSKLDGISGVIDILADDMSDMQKKELYNLNTPYDLKDDLDDDEKEIVVCSLLYLSKFTKNNEYQMKFLRSVINYTDMRTPSGDFNIACIENIESIKVQKIIMQTLMEYLYLETEDFSFLDRLENVFGYFSVNRKGIQEIEANIETIYRATGKEGLAEKYGFVPVEETPAGNAETVSAKENYEFPCYDGSDISEACADKINIHQPYIILRDYLVYHKYGSEEICCIHKQTGKKKIINIDIKDDDSIDGYGRDLYDGYGRYLYLFRGNDGIYMIDVEDGSDKKIKDLKEQCAGLRCNEKYLFYYTQKRQGYIEMESMKEREIKLEYFTKESNFILVNNVIYYFGAREDSSYQDILYKYNLETGEQKKILEDYKVACSFLNQTTPSNGQQMFQCGKYLISVDDSKYENEIYFYCLDMENDRFDSINIPDTKLYGTQAMAAVAYNYIYCFYTSSAIERYDIITRKKEKIINSNHIVSSYREGIRRKKVEYISDFQIIGDYIYFTEYGGVYRGDFYRIDTKRKEEVTLGSGLNED